MVIKEDLLSYTYCNEFSNSLYSNNTELKGNNPEEL